MIIRVFLLPVIILASVLGACSAILCDPLYESAPGTTLCIRVSSDFKTFLDAYRSCKYDGGDLVSIHNAFLNTYLATNYPNVLIGLYFDGNFSNYKWSDGTPLDYTYYDDNFIAWRDYFGYCAKVQANKKWGNVECDTERMQYACQKEGYDYPISPPSVCPPSSEHYLDGGMLYSPGYPGNHSEGLQCSYLLVVRNDYNISLTFDYVDERYSSAIYVYNGKTTDYLLGRVTDVTSTNVTFVTVNSNFMLLYFITNSYGVWKARWTPIPAYPVTPNTTTTAVTVPKTTACPLPPTTYPPVPPGTLPPHPIPSVSPPDECPLYGNVYYDEADVYSPGYPGRYGPNLDCTYMLMGRDPTTPLAITFTYLQLSSGDYIELYDVLSSTPFASTRKNQIGVNYTLRSKSAHVNIKFHSGLGGWGTWSANFYTAYVCPTDYYYNYGQISSPGYPYDYQTDLSCIYRLYVLGGYRVKLQFQFIETSSCCDIISIYDGLDTQRWPDHQLSGNYSYNSIEFVSTENVMVIQFTTGPWHPAGLRGWQATFGGVKV